MEASAIVVVAVPFETLPEIFMPSLALAFVKRVPAVQPSSPEISPPNCTVVGFVSPAPELAWLRLRADVLLYAVGFCCCGCRVTVFVSVILEG